MNRRTGSCLALLFIFAFAAGMPRFVRADEDPVALQRRLQEIQDQIAADQKELAQAKGQANTLANAIVRLAKQQALLALQIQASDLQISETETRQAQTQQQIDDNQAHLDRLRTGMGESLRMMREMEEEPPFMVLLRTGDLFAAVEAAHQQADLVAALVDSNGKAEELDATLLAQRTALEQVEEDARNLQAVRTLQQGEVVASKGKQQTLLTVTKGKEEAYVASIADNKAQAAEIRQRIYDLLGVGTKVTFGEAVKMAQWVSSATGIRPAFLLSVLSQESNLGANVGTCNRPGDPASKGWRQIMKPERDQKPFQDITSALGRNPDITPVSCPMRDAKGNRIGWGGAMGPAQFIPSTWVGYEKKVSSLTGHAADPWDIRDAFAASAIKLVADGAGSPSGEWAAAMRYFSGSTDPRFRFYGDQVMDRAEGYQKDIDAL